jgi:hypothetical protein
METVAMLDTTTGEVVKFTVLHESNNVRELYSKLPRAVVEGIEPTGSMQGFLNLMEEVGIECQVGNPAKIRAAERRKQKPHVPKAGLILTLQVEDDFSAI